MTISSAAKLVLCASFILTGSAWGFSTQPNLECGTYRVQGVIALNSQSQFVLKVQAHTSSAYELILLGGSPQEKLDRVGFTVTAVVYVPKEIKSNNAPFVAFQQWSRANLPADEPVLKLKPEVCGLLAKFKKN